jgi:hypothetical protein
MWEFLTSALSAIPSAASNKYALGAYALAICAYVITVWRVARNKNLLDNLQKLPSKDRLSALEIETGGVRLAAGISPEQWVRSRIHKYYLFAFLATCAVAVAIAALAAWKGATYVGTLTIINNEYQRSNNGESLSSSDLQHIKELIDAATTRDPEQARTAFNQLSEKARAAYEGAYPLTKDNLPSPGDLTSGASTTPPVTKPSAVATDRNPATARTEVNLLSPEQGGQAVVVPSSEWLKAISGKDGESAGGADPGKEAVYAFKDEKPATFWKFAILVIGSDDHLPKDIELLVADDSPQDPKAFRSIGKITVTDALIVKTPYQEFPLPETTGKYVKIKILSLYGGCCGELPQIRILGKPVQ